MRAREWGFEHVMSSPRHPKANGKAESAMKIIKSLCRKAVAANEDPWKAILCWRNTPTEGLHCSPAQRLMSRRLRTPLPVADQLLMHRVATGIPEKLRGKHQIAKRTYDRSARDLSELNVSQPIRMKPLPGDWTCRWRRGPGRTSLMWRGPSIAGTGSISDWQREPLPIHPDTWRLWRHVQQQGASQARTAPACQTAIAGRRPPLP